MKGKPSRERMLDICKIEIRSWGASRMLREIRAVHRTKIIGASGACVMRMSWTRRATPTPHPIGPIDSFGLGFIPLLPIRCHAGQNERLSWLVGSQPKGEPCISLLSKQSRLSNIFLLQRSRIAISGSTAAGLVAHRVNRRQSHRLTKHRVLTRQPRIILSPSSIFGCESQECSLPGTEVELGRDRDPAPFAVRGFLLDLAPIQSNAKIFL